MRIVASSLVHAMALGRTFVLDAATSAYVDPLRCEGRGFPCLFARSSNCTAEHALAALHWNGSLAAGSAAVQLASRLAELPRLAVPASAAPRVISGRTSCTNKLDDAAAAALRAALAAEHARLAAAEARAAERAPPPDVEPDMGWFVRQASAYVARPNEWTSALAAELHSSLRLDGRRDGRRGEESDEESDESNESDEVRRDDEARRGAADARYIGSRYIGVHIRRGDKVSEAATHDTAAYAAAVREVARRRGIRRVLLTADDPEPYETLPQLLAPDAIGVTWVPTEQWAVRPERGRLVAAKMVERIYQAARQPSRSAPGTDEGMLLAAQAVLLSRAAACVGTLTSNYLLLVAEMAEYQRPAGAAPLEVIDLDGNEYYPCTVRERPPWGPKFGRRK